MLGAMIMLRTDSMTIKLPDLPTAAGTLRSMLPAVGRHTVEQRMAAAQLHHTVAAQLHMAVQVGKAAVHCTAVVTSQWQQVQLEQLCCSSMLTGWQLLAQSYLLDCLTTNCPHPATRSKQRLIDFFI